MNRDKQIEEMCKIVCQCNNNGTCIISLRPCDCECSPATELGKLYNAGYRKASEVAREIFEEIDKKLDDITIVMGALDSLRTFLKTIEKVTAVVNELKKKYESEKDDDTH